MTINSSTINGNSNNGIYHIGNALEIYNSTISGNSATVSSGGILSLANLIISNSTTSGNSALGGGGIARYAGTAKFQNTIIANNSSGNSYPGPMTSGYNLSR